MSGSVKKRANEILSEPITVAVLGSGGREHALAAKIAESSFCKKVIVLPGNDGISMISPSVATHNADVTDFVSLGKILKKLSVDLVVVGPDNLLAAGVVDALSAQGFAVFGPSARAARIESSKSFAKAVMREADVPTAKYVELKNDDSKALAEAAEKLGGYPLVLKYDGLALGKGVRICADSMEAGQFLTDVFQGQLFSRGADGQNCTVIAEEFLSGHEVSLFALTDGQVYEVLEPACDHKRLLDGNNGPNTGGMGAYSPVPWLTGEQVSEMAKIIFPPLLSQMREQNAQFKGLLYAGLMVRGRDFWVLEFNARFGDPETQAILPRLESDLLVLLWSIAVDCFDRHRIAFPLRWAKSGCVNVVAASQGYPNAPQTGMPIEGLLQCKHGKVFCAAVKLDGKNLVTAGGRVFSVSCVADGIAQAAQNAQGCLKEIRFEGMQYRKDVGRLSSIY